MQTKNTKAMSQYKRRLHRNGLRFLFFFFQILVYIFVFDADVFNFGGFESYKINYAEFVQHN